MEPLLICRFRLDEATVLRFREERFRTVRLLNLVFTVFCLGIGAYMLYRSLRKESIGFYDLLPTLFFFAAAGVLLYEAIFAIPRGVKKFIDMTERAFGSRETELVIRFYPDRFTTENSHKPGPTDRSYGDVAEVFRGKTTAAFMMKDGNMISLDPGRFENGAEADFWKLMNEVCPKAVPRKYQQV